MRKYSIVLIATLNAAIGIYQMHQDSPLHGLFSILMAIFVLLLDGRISAISKER